MTSRWSRRAWAVQPRSCSSVARPPAAATRAASDGFASTTIQRPPSWAVGRSPSRLSQPAAPVAGASAPLAPETRSSARTRAPRARRAAASELRQQTHTHPARGPPASRTGSANRAAEAIMAALSVQSASGARAASASAARSSEFAATPPTTAIRSEPATLGRLAQAAGQRGHDRALVGGGEVRAPRLERLRRPGLARRRGGRSSAPRRRSRARARARPGTERLGVAHAGERVDRGAARVAEPEQPRALVERLAGCVVERRPEPLERAVVAHREQQRVASAREQAGEGRLERARGRGRARRRARARWSTATSGIPRDQATAFAAERPTRSAPISPGPRVTPMRSTSVELGAGLVRAPRGRRGRRAPGGAGRRPPGRRRRSGRGARPARRRRRRAIGRPT